MDLAAIKVYDGVIPFESVDSIRFKKYSNSEEITIYTVGGREYRIKAPVLTEREEKMVVEVILNPSGYVDLRKFIESLVKLREVGE